MPPGPSSGPSRWRPRTLRVPPHSAVTMGGLGDLAPRRSPWYDSPDSGAPKAGAQAPLQPPGQAPDSEVRGSASARSLPCKGKRSGQSGPAQGSRRGAPGARPTAGPPWSREVLALPPGSPCRPLARAWGPSARRGSVTARLPIPARLLLPSGFQGPLNWILDTHSLWGQARADVLTLPVLIL